MMRKHGGITILVAAAALVAALGACTLVTSLGSDARERVETPSPAEEVPSPPVLACPVGDQVQNTMLDWAEPPVGAEEGLGYPSDALALYLDSAGWPSDSLSEFAIPSDPSESTLATASFNGPAHAGEGDVDAWAILEQRPNGYWHVSEFETCNSTTESMIQAAKTGVGR